MQSIPNHRAPQRASLSITLNKNRKQSIDGIQQMVETHHLTEIEGADVNCGTVKKIQINASEEGK